MLSNNIQIKMSALTSILNTEDYQNYPKGRVKAYSPFNIRVGKQDIVGHPFLRNANIQPVDALYQQAQISNTPRLGESSTLSNLSRSTNIGDIQPQRQIIFKDQEGGEYMEVQMGEGFLKTLKKGFKKAKKIGKAVKKVAGVVKGVAGVAEKIGVPGASVVKAVAGKTQKTLKKVGLGDDGTEYYQDMEGGSFFKKLKKGIKKGVKVIGKVGKVADVASEIAGALGKEELSKQLKTGATIGKAVGKLSGEGQTPQAIGRAGNPIAMRGMGLQEEIQKVSMLPRGVRGADSMTFSALHPLNYTPAINRLP